MDKKTYEALKRIMKSLNLEYQRNYPDLPKDAIQVNDWIDEVAKEYVENICSGCGEPIEKGQARIEGENRHAVCS